MTLWWQRKHGVAKMLIAVTKGEDIPKLDIIPKQSTKRMNRREDLFDNLADSHGQTFIDLLNSAYPPVHKKIDVDNDSLEQLTKLSAEFVSLMDEYYLWKQYDFATGYLLPDEKKSLGI